MMTMSRRIKIYFNQLKLKFDTLEKFESKLNNTHMLSQTRILLFDLSFIFRFLYGKTVREDCFEGFFDKSRVLELTVEVINVFAHYKRFFYDKAKASTYFYIYRSKPTDSEVELEVTKNIIKITDYLHGFNYVGDEGTIDKSLLDALKIIKGTKILDKENISKPIQNIIIYNFTSHNTLFPAYLYEICEIGLENPFCVIHYESGEVFVNRLEDFFMNGKLKGIFNEYDKKFQLGQKYNINVPKPKICIPLLDKTYHRIIYKEIDGEVIYAGKSREAINSFIEQYISGNYITCKEVNEFYKEVTTSFVDSTLCQNMLKRWSKKLFDTEIYTLDVLKDNDVKIQWILGEKV